MIDPEIYARAVSKDRNVRLALAKDEATPPTILYLLSHDYDDFEVELSADGNPSTPSRSEVSEWAKSDDGFNDEGIHALTGTRFNETGYDREGFDDDGEDGDFYNREGYDRKGFDRSGIHSNGTPYDDNGNDVEGYDADGWTTVWKEWQHDGYRAVKIDREGYNADGFNAEGVSRDGVRLFDEDGYNHAGYKPATLKWQGARRRVMIDRDGYAKSGFNAVGLRRDGYDKHGFDASCIHRDTGTHYDADGYDWRGFHETTLVSRNRKKRLSAARFWSPLYFTRQYR